MRIMCIHGWLIVTKKRLSSLFPFTSYNTSSFLIYLIQSWQDKKLVFDLQAEALREEILADLKDKGIHTS